MSNSHIPSYQKIDLVRQASIKEYLQLLKIYLCLYISLSAILGHVMAQGEFTSHSMGLGGFILFLAMGAAVLNNIQDRNYDRAFPRTMSRVLPQNRIPVRHAFFISTILILFGLTGIFIMGSWKGLVTGILSVFLYNGCYTPLKKRTLLAIVPGTLSGMIPVLIGWAVAGGSVIDFHLLILMSILGIWQIPHYFILLLNNSQKHRPLNVGRQFPSFIDILTNKEIKAQILIWTGLYSLSLFWLVLSGPVLQVGTSMAIGLNAIGILGFTTFLFSPFKPVNLTYAFVGINFSMLLFLTSGIIDRLTI